MAASGKEHENNNADSRRRFLLGTLKAACGAAIFGLGVGLNARPAVSLPTHALRPPGALPEKEFQAACIRCGLCVEACPYKALHLARSGDKVATGTPYYIARQQPCEMCDDIPCVKACPTNALDSKLTKIDEARMGLAVVIDQETCLNYLGLRCGVCYRSCPLLDKAITLNAQHNVRSGKHTLFLPTVHSDYCTGCGKCEKACVLEEPAIKIVDRRLAKGELGHHYRLGWEEKRKAGHSLIPEQLDLPDRTPDEGTFQQPGWKP